MKPRCISWLKKVACLHRLTFRVGNMDDLAVISEDVDFLKAFHVCQAYLL